MLKMMMQTNKMAWARQVGRKASDTVFSGWGGGKSDLSPMKKPIKNTRQRATYEAHLSSVISRQIHCDLSKNKPVA